MAGTFGATIGALVAYAIGYYGGRPVLERWGRFLRITPADLDKTDAFFARHGTKAAFFGRLIPVVRSLVSFAAGIGHMPLLPFTFFTALGSLPFTFVLVFAGMQLGANWEVDRRHPQAVRVRDPGGGRPGRDCLRLAALRPPAPAEGRLTSVATPAACGGGAGGAGGADRNAR